MNTLQSTKTLSLQARNCGFLRQAQAANGSHIYKCSTIYIMLIRRPKIALKAFFVQYLAEISTFQTYRGQAHKTLSSQARDCGSINASAGCQRQPQLQMLYNLNNAY